MIDCQIFCILVNLSDQVTGYKVLFKVHMLQRTKGDEV